MNIELKPVTRDNWEDVLSLQLTENQRQYVPSVAVSLAKIYIKPDGDEVVYLPFAIYHHEKIVGFMMHAFDEKTENMYWINGFIIDAREQRKGYGKAALDKMISWMTNKFSQCSEVRLTVHKDNGVAKNMYKRRGFMETGEWFGEEEVLKLVVRVKPEDTKYA